MAVQLQALTSNDLRELLAELADITPKWYYIGLQLGLKPSTDLDPIQSQNSDPLQCMCNMVKQWLKISPHPTWKDLIDALSSPLVCEEYQANHLRLKYCETSTTRRDVSQISEDSVQAVWTRGEKPNLLSLLSFHNEIGHINILQQVEKKCRSFGVLLLNDETGAKIKAIISECRGDPEQIILEIVKQWMKGNGKPVSWDVLIHVLNDIGLKTLARDIEEEIHH